jgi:hypothetical protein
MLLNSMDLIQQVAAPRDGLIKAPRQLVSRCFDAVELHLHYPSHFDGFYRPLSALFALPAPRAGRTAPYAGISCRRTIHKLDSANSISTWAVFLAKPR